MFMIPLFTLFLIGPAMADEVAFTQISVEVKNRSGHPIACSAQLAHWFSTELGSRRSGWYHQRRFHVRSRHRNCVYPEQCRRADTG